MPALSAESEKKLALIDEKINGGRRLTVDDGLFLYEEAPLEWLKDRATRRRRELHGEEAYYNRNIHFEPTNICIYACKFCAFYRPPKAANDPASGAWDFSFDDLRAKLEAYPAGSLTEIHITGGVHPDRGVEYGEALCAFIRDLRPEVHIK